MFHLLVNFLSSRPIGSNHFILFYLPLDPITGLEDMLQEILGFDVPFRTGYHCINQQRIRSNEMEARPLENTMTPYH